MAKRLWMVFVGLSAVIGLASVSLFITVTGAGASPIWQEESGEIAFPDPDDSLVAAAEWLVADHQNADGGFASFSVGADQAPSDPGGTLDALLALAAANAEITRAVDYLATHGEDLVGYVATDGSTAGKTILALSAAGEDPGSFTGHDYVLDLADHLTPAGDFSVATAYNQSLAIMALAAVGEPIPEEAIQWLIESQETSGELRGSWDDGFGTPGNADSTAVAVMALIAAGRDASDTSLAAGLDYLESTRLASGGWEYGVGFGENANSTALALQALKAGGRSVTLEALLRWQGDSGAFQADLGEGRFDDFFSTVQSIPAVSALNNSASSAGENSSWITYGIIGVVALVVVILVVWLISSRRRGEASTSS